MSSILSTSYTAQLALEQYRFANADKPTSTSYSAGTSDPLREKAEDFESVFLSKFMEPLFPKDESGYLFGGGQGGDIYRQWMIDEYAKGFAAGGGVGLSDQIYASLVKLQEVQP